jgi:hypothetical protein
VTEQPDTIATMPCRSCGHDVPAGRFCGRCGAHLTSVRGDGPQWLRVHDYAAAPGENVLQPSVVSSMFPHLPRRSRGTFRAGLTLVAAVLIVCCALHWYVPMVAVATFAPLVLFGFYLVETGVFADLPRWVWALALLLGAAGGVGWAQLTSAIVAESYSLGLGTEVPTARLIRNAVAIPFGGLLAMQLPVVLIRLTRPPGRESLYGFAVGALSATMFAIGAIMARFIPMLGTSLTTGDQPVPDLLLEAGVRSVTMPLTAASIGGLVGAGLWYARRDGPDRRGLLVVGALGLVAVAALYASVGLIDAFRLAPALQFVIHVVLALAAVVALRFGLQLAMLREPHEPMHPELPIACPGCGHVVPDMTFCPACGVASHAASRTSREARRRDRPQPGVEAVR